MTEIECVAQTKDLIGELPVWSPAEQALYWVDVTAPAVRRYHPGTSALCSWRMAEDIGSIGLRRGGGLVAGMRSGLYFLALETNERALLAAPTSHDPHLRFNDGKLMRGIPLPVRHPLMCTFGGPDLSTLYVTTSLALAAPGEAQDQPLAGSLFAIYGCGCVGLAEPAYAG